MNILLQDLRFAIRVLVKSPGFTAVALITLALGIGANTGLYTFLHAKHLIPQRFDTPEELMLLQRSPDAWRGADVRAPDFLEWREQAESFADMGIYRSTDDILAGVGEPGRVRVVRSSANVLPMFGFSPQLGRFHGPADDQVGAAPVAVLSDGLWRRRFEQSADVLGRTILLSDEPYTIIGVMPPEVDFDQPWYHTDVVTPLPIDTAVFTRKSGRFYSIARLKPEVSARQALAELRAIDARLAAAYPDTNAKLEVFVMPLLDRFLPADDGLSEKAILLAVGAVLLIACVNLANMQLARATSRGREFAVRAALGAGRGRIVRQLLTESLLLSLIGGAGGLLVGMWAVDIFVANYASQALRPEETRLDWPVLTYGLVASLAAALVFGLTPALAASKVSLNETLKEGGAVASAGRSRNRLRDALVVGQLAISLPLFICCGLAIRHVQTLKASGTVGFNPERIIAMQVDLPKYRYEAKERQVNFYRDALETVRAMPGIEAAGATYSLPIGEGNFASVLVSIEGLTDDQRPPGYVPGYRSVTPGYFKTMQIPLIRGRRFGEHDLANSQPVAVVNQRAASAYWPNEDAIGKRVNIDNKASPPRWITIVGVVGDAGCTPGGESPRATLFLPHEQAPLRRMTLVARTLGDPMNVAAGLRAAIHAKDPGVPLGGVRTVDGIIQRWLRKDRLFVGFLLGVAGLALGLAAIGLYGVMSYAVAQRTHEIGVRVALGAERHDVMRLVLRRCLTLTAVGIGVGIVLSIPVSILLARQLYGVGAVDPATFIGVPIVLLVVAMLAGYLPARRATRVDPVVALRYE